MSDINDLIFPAPQLVSNPGLVEDFAAQSEENTIALSVFEAFGRMSDDPAELVAPGRPGADVLFVLGLNPADESQLLALRLGEMSTVALANHLPQYVPKAMKPKVFFVGGRTGNMVMALAQVLPASGSQGDNDGEQIDRGGEIAALAVLPDDPEFEAQLAQTYPHGATVMNLRLFQGVEVLDGAQVSLLLEAGLLQTQEAAAGDVFTDRPAETWRNLMKRRPFPENLFSTWANFPERN